MPSEEEIRAVVQKVVAELDSGRESSARLSHTRDSDGIAIGADHGGFRLKEKLISYLREQGYTVDDCGTSSGESVDYPDFAHAVARKVGEGNSQWGIIVDGAGIGSCMVANKVPGVRAALCYDISSACNSREHNHANVLTLGAGLVGDSLARQIVDAWLKTPWGPGRHADRVDKIDAVEKTYLKS
jgi:RpiB/LacA/LacB family sugar-phosphate isomerase